jgi:Protein of unknown function (DUF3987)
MNQPAGSGAVHRADSAATDVDRWPHPPAPAAFAGLAGDLVAMLAPHTEADPAALLAQLIVAAGSMIGPGPHYQVGASRHPTNEFVVLVGPSGSGRKGSAWDMVEAVCAQVDPGWAARRVVSGLSSGEGLIWHLRDEAGDTDRRLLVLEAEFASALKGTVRDTSTLSPVLRNAWDGRVLQVLTKHDPARATGTHVAVIGHITASELVRYLSATELANGFVNRFLLIACRRAQLLPEGGNLDLDALGPLLARLADTVAWARRQRRLRFDDAARERWWSIYPSLSASRPGLSGAICARAEAHVVRLALIYALLDGVGAIAPRHLNAALALWDYAERTVAYVFGDSLGDPVADELWSAISAAPGGLGRSEIRDLFARNRPRAQIDNALSVLRQAGRVTRQLRPGPGRPTEIWTASSTIAANHNDGRRHTTSP